MKQYPSRYRAFGIILCTALLLGGCRAVSFDAAATPQMKQVSVNGAAFAYQDEGAGKPVLFVHGCCTDLRAWDSQRQAVTAHDRFVALNLRYHGTAPWADDGSHYSIQTHVDDVAAFIRELHAGPVDLVGWSYSGPIVMLVTLQHPGLVRSLAIHEPGSLSFVTDPAQLKAGADARVAMLGPAVAAAKAGDAAAASRLVPIGVNHQPDFWETASPQVRSMFADNARTIPLAFVKAPPPPPLTCEQLHQVRVPTLITYGSDTGPFYRIAAQAAAACIPGAQLSAIPSGRHLAIMQQSQAFNAVLLQFLARSR